jgi:hypothetical protein
MAGALGGMGVAELAGYVLKYTGSYIILFSMASGAYLLALLLMHCRTGPRVRPQDGRGSRRSVPNRAISNTRHR